MESHDAEFSEAGRTPISKEAALRLWLNSAYGKYTKKMVEIPQPTQPRSVEPPRGESEPPRKKDAGERGWTELTLEDVAEMYAIHAAHMGLGRYTDCACIELCERALEKLLARAQHTAEQGGASGGRAFRHAVLKVAEEL